MKHELLLRRHRHYLWMIRDNSSMLCNLSSKNEKYDTFIRYSFTHILYRICLI